MFAKATLLLALFAASAHLAVAAPPACLLAAVNTEPDPSNQTTVCGADASRVEAQIQNLCGNNTGAAMSAFSSACSEAGHTVPTASASKSGSSSTSVTTSSAGDSTIASSSGDSTITSSITVASTLGASGSATTGVPLDPASGGKATSSSSGSSTSTGGSPRATFGSFAAAVIAAAGLAIGV
ncbi:MAG: hypothetical protein FRX48_06091 [Lasallia pustulata]|uniref:Gpi anchored cell wall n=1 Tax=Lasallia pustulata TaxID=136370 RepID=A0A1W5DCX2_9LECA|nr:MAG: hypothetical protein FRX48_06091 [Lasallia pustulata]SLM40855.1 hypothetical protein LPUS_11708 [Lasallia pustulata]